VARSPSPFRESDVTRAIRAAKKAGVEIARVEIEPGKITVIVGKPEPEQATDLDKWLGKHNAH
jgi:hypothetical protein